MLTEIKVILNDFEIQKTDEILYQLVLPLVSHLPLAHQLVGCYFQWKKYLVQGLINTKKLIYHRRTWIDR